MADDNNVGNLRACGGAINLISKLGCAYMAGNNSDMGWQYLDTKKEKE